MDRQWLVNKTKPEYIHYFAKKNAVSAILAQILINRGLKTPEEIRSFLNPDITKMSDPFDLPDMQKAVQRIRTASEKGEKVLVHGDYDADGLTATAIVVKALKMLGITYDFFIPNRMVHGYGFTPASVLEAKKKGASLIITVDCGITSFSAVSQSNREGIDVIITDHHEPKKIPPSVSQGTIPKTAQTRQHEFSLPEAFAVINPKTVIHSPAVDLSGAGVALKLVQALFIDHGFEDIMSRFLDLAALGTIADVVPLTGENRMIVKEGLDMIGHGTNTGLLALQRVSGIKDKFLKPGRLLFSIIPRINAPGRVSDARSVINLLSTDSEEEAMDIASWLDQQNSERQRIEATVYQEALTVLEQKGVTPFIVLSAEGWHKGVIGIVASRIAETFTRPVIILSIDGDTARGSARSIPAIDIYDALSACRDCLSRFGGHKQAAGLELRSQDIPLFEDSLNRVIVDRMDDQDFTPALHIDAHINLSDVSFQLLKEFALLEPFGTGNPEPLLGSKSLEAIEPRVVGNGHLKMKLRQKKNAVDAIGFDMASYMATLESSYRIDVVFTPFINEWNGSRHLNLNLKALRPSIEN